MIFENLGARLQQVVKKLRGQARLTEQNMAETLREVRVALLEADVALPVVKHLIETVRQRALGQEILTSLTPGQAAVKVVHDALTELMGTHNDRLDLAARPPAVVLMAGLQGSGKTTTSAKLARYLRERERKSVMMVSCDVYRPAAIRQLETLAGQVGATFFPSLATDDPVDIARRAREAAAIQAKDVLIVDTAGRLHVDEDMMREIRAIHAAVDPIETLFVVDSMTGQDAVNTARSFNAVLPLTGLVLTKTDGDARGGAALSLRHVTGKPVKFLGIGEKTDALEPFHPDRLASRILGMGDVLTLVEEATRAVDADKARAVAAKIARGKGFDLEDFRDQIGQMHKLGGLSGLVDKLPGMGGRTPSADQLARGEREIHRMVAIINSMTPAERRDPDILRATRKRRVAAGSGTQVQDVNRLLKQFDDMSRMMKRLGKGGGFARMLKGMGGKLPGLPM